MASITPAYSVATTVLILKPVLALTISASCWALSNTACEFSEGTKAQVISSPLPTSAACVAGAAALVAAATGAASVAAVVAATVAAVVAATVAATVGAVVGAVVAATVAA